MQVVQIPNWLGKTPFLGKLLKPLSKGKGSGSLSTEDRDLIMKITQEFKDLSAKDIENWRLALDALNDPKNPRWYLFQDLLDYLEPDYQLGTSKDLRVSATLGKKFLIYDKRTGKENPEKTKLFEHKEWFFNFIWHQLDAIFYGYTVCQLTDAEKMKFYYVPRRNVIPQKDMIVFEVGGDKGIVYTDPAFDGTIIANKYKHEKGIVNDIIPNLIWKKNSRHAWAEFAEKFGIPMISATTDKSDKKTLDRIEAMMKALGEAATAILPTGTTITIHDQATKGDPYNVFLKQIELDDKAIAKRLLGGTMLTDDGSSRSQGEVHERNLHDALGLFDKMMTIFVVNDFLIPLMAKNGYPLDENDGFKFDESQKIGMSDHWKIVNEALDRYEIPDEWVSQNFNFPITGKKQTEKGNFNSATKAMAASLVAHGVTLPNYFSMCGHLHSPKIEASFSSMVLEKLSEILLNEVWEGKDTMTTEVLKSIATHRNLMDGLLEGWSDRRMQLTYDATDLHCLASMEYNIFEFSRMKEKANVFALNDLKLNKEKNNIRSFNEFRDKALPYLKNADVNWLKSEYGHTIAVGQGASRYHQFMSERKTVTNYVIIQTIGDSAVRESHKALDGKILKLDEKGGAAIWVPFDIGCRCEMLQYLGTVDENDVYTSKEIYEAIDKKQGDKWTGNKGLEEQVFAANEFYVKSKGIAEEINKIKFSDYKLKPYAEIKKNYPAINLDKSITPENVKELFKHEKGKTYMGFEDYLGRKMTLKKKVFDEHTQSEKYTKQNRHQLFAKLEDVLSDPDEVYYFKFNKGNFQTRYIKFYNDGAVVVATDLGSESVEINTWFNMDNESANRKGYLIHKKP